MNLLLYLPGQKENKFIYTSHVYENDPNFSLVLSGKMHILTKKTHMIIQDEWWGY